MVYVLVIGVHDCGFAVEITLFVVSVVGAVSTGVQYSVMIVLSLVSNE